MTSSNCVLEHYDEPDKSRSASAGFVCRGCYARIERYLAEFPGLDDDLVRAHSIAGPQQERVTGGDVEARLPIRDDIADFRRDLLDRIAMWARIVVEEKSVGFPDGTVQAISLFLLTHLKWIVEQDWISDFDYELRPLRGAAFGKAFPNGRRKFKVDVCPEDECSGNLIAMLNDVDSLLPATLTCDYDPTHTWHAGVGEGSWQALGRRIMAAKDAVVAKVAEMTS